MVYGRMPQKYRLSSMITVAGTIDANIALQKPGGYDAIDRAWDNLTNDEKKFVVARPDIAAGFLVFAEQAVTDTISNFPGQTDRADGTGGNAFQHALWNAMMAQWHPEYAEEYGFAHEAYARDPNDARQTTLRNMDLNNNAVGRQINNRFATRQELGVLVMHALQTGQLTVTCPGTC